MNNLSAAVGCAQIENIKNNEAKKKYLNWYYAFKDFEYIDIIKEPKYSRCNYWLITGFLK